ncbi:MAG: sulfate ABC transporter permease subunit CysT [Cyanobacteriota bacterium]
MTLSDGSSESSVNPLKALGHLSWPWRVTFLYLSFILLPLTALVLRASTVGPAEFWRIATDRVAVSSYEVTFVTALMAALINGILGTLTAWVLVRYPFPGKKVIEGIIDLPFALPTAVAGLTLATVYSSNGWLGSLVAPLGIRISFTRLGVGVAMLFISFPFVVRAVQPVLQEIEKEVEEAAWSLGASPWQTFWKVILPQLLAAILTGVALGFSRAIGEYGSIVMIASSIPFRDLISAVLVIQRLEQFDYAGATVIGTVLLFISLVSLIAINLLQAWGRRYEA